MPSPAGHALGGVAAGLLVLGRRPLSAEAGGLRQAAVLALVGMLPDLDLVVGLHSGPTHGIGAALIAGLAALAFRWVTPAGAVAIAAAYASHTLLDWLGSDTSPPIGIMALWPFSTRYFQSDLRLFGAVSRRYWLPEQFIWGNLRSLVRELLILIPVLAVILAWRRRPRGGRTSAPVAARREREGGTQYS